MRTTLWVVPMALLVIAVALFVVTYQVDRNAHQHGSVLPSWI
jgi:cytochrome c-type biogenesis protein CcmH/NrfF